MSSTINKEFITALGNELKNARQLIDRSASTSPKIDNQRMAQLQQSCRINPMDDISEPPYILSIGDVPVMSKGDFSLILGRAKSRKTFLVIYLTALYFLQNKNSDL